MSGLAALGAVQGRPLAPFTSLKVGGAAEWYLVAREVEQAIQALRVAADQGMPITFLGGGTNLLVSDRGVAGLVLKPAFSRVEVIPHGGDALLCAESGQPFPGLARKLARQGWAGLEWAISVPGTVGGAVVNNSGAFGGAVQDSLLAIDAVDALGNRRCIRAESLDYAYRHSILKVRQLGSLLVVAARFALSREDPQELRRRVEHFQEQRTRTQPRQSSAGSIFANPEGDYAGRLIEASGLKGIGRGSAQISEQHANFIVNRGGATAGDVHALMVLARREVGRRCGAQLHLEIQLVGRWNAEERAALEADAP